MSTLSDFTKREAEEKAKAKKTSKKTTTTK